MGIRHDGFNGGWSYPPGCTGPPDPISDESELVETVSNLLEDNEVPEDVQLKIVELIQEWEQSRTEDYPQPDEYHP